MKKLLFLSLAVCSLAFSQAVRLDPTPIMTTAANVPPGAMAPVLAIPGSKVHVCQYPANSASGVPCTNYATTYTDPTENTACPTNAQLVLAGTTTCVSTADAQGNYGFWVAPGPIYTYTVTIPQGTTFGPYEFTPIVQGTTGAVIYNEGSTGAVNRTATSRLQDFMSVKDFGATGNGTTDDATAINAGITAACAVGAKLFMPPGHYLVNSTLSFPNGCEGVEFSGPSNNEAVTPGARIIWGGAANGTVLSVYGTSWCRFHDFTVDGASTAGIGIFFYADTVSPFLRSSQKDLFSHIYVRNVIGTPGYCVQVGRSTSGDDVSQTTFSDFSIDHCVVGVYQAGSQTVENLYHHNTFGSSISQYGMRFDGGDVHLSDNMFIGGGPATKIANIYVASTALRADLERDYYEDNASTGLDPTVFSNYLFAKGANPNRPFPTKLDSERVQWNIVGGKVLDYEQAAPITIINPTGDDINQPNEPGTYYITSGNHIQTVYAKFIGGFLATPSQIAFVDDNVVATSDTPANQIMANVIDGYDASVTSGSATLTIGASHSFTSSMVGYFCYVQTYLSGNIAQQNAITAFTDSTHVTLASAATNTASGLYYRCGRLVNGGQANTAISDSVNMASNVVEGQLPQYQLRRFLSGSIWQNWAWRVDTPGAHLSLMSGDNPASATYSDFMTLNAATTGGTVANSITTVPLHIGSATHQQVGIYYQDFTGIAMGSIAAGGSFSTTLTLTGDTVTAGVDGCEAWGGILAGIVTQCSIVSANGALVTYGNLTASPIAVGTVTVRVQVTKFSYTGP